MAVKAARSQPTPGILAIATPTARKAPARVKFAVVPATALAVCAPWAAAFAPEATALCSWAAVLASTARASSVSATVAAFTIPVHHFLRLFNVTSRNALSLFKVCATCCIPIVIAITLWTLVITFCRLSFSPAKRDTAPVAADSPPDNPDMPCMTPWNFASSFARIRPCCEISPWISWSRPSSSTSFLYASLSSLMPLSTRKAISSFNSLIRLRRDWCAFAFVSTARVASSLFWASCSRASERLLLSANTCLRTAISPWILACRSCIACTASWLPAEKAAPASFPSWSYCASSLAISASWISHAVPIFPRACLMFSLVAWKALSISSPLDAVSSESPCTRWTVSSIALSKSSFSSIALKESAPLLVFSIYISVFM